MIWENLFTSLGATFFQLDRNIWDKMEYIMPLRINTFLDALFTRITTQNKEPVLITLGLTIFIKKLKHQVSSLMITIIKIELVFQHDGLKRLRAELVLERFVALRCIEEFVIAIYAI